MLYTAASRFIGLYLRPKIIAVFILGISSGLPLALTGSTFSALLVTYGVDIKTIGLFGLLSIPYVLKFIWSPLIDNLPIPMLSCALGKRKSWLIIIQILLMISIVKLGSLSPVLSFTVFAMFAFLVSFLSATQDIIIDAFRTELLDERELGAGAAVATAGYRIGMVISSAGALYLAQGFSWQFSYFCMSLFIIPGLITALWCKDPAIQFTDKPLSAAEWVDNSIIQPFARFMERDKWVSILIFLIFYKLSDAYLGMMTTPLLMSLDFSFIEIANIVKLFGTAMTFAGIFLGGYLIERVGIPKTLVWGCLASIISNLVFILQFYAGHNINILAVTIGVENFTGGISTAALIAYISKLCDLRFTATHFALLSSFASFARTAISGTAGYVVDAVGWGYFFAISALLSTPALILAKYLFFNNEKRG